MRFRRPFGQILKGKIEPYGFQVGILKDGPHKNPKSKKKGLKTFAGGPARKIGSKSDGTISEVSAEVRKRAGFNYLRKPFNNKNDDAVKMLKTFFQLVFADSEGSKRKRLENLLQAIVRNPILRGTYGRNRRLTADIKGFNRKFIDTGQFFKAITAKVTKKAGAK